MNSNRNYLPAHDYTYENLEQIISDMDNYDNFRQHIANKLSKRRAQAKANLAGLWGVPTRFAWTESFKDSHFEMKNSKEFFFVEIK